jgi:hypothetical protein
LTDGSTILVGAGALVHADLGGAAAAGEQAADDAVLVDLGARLAQRTTDIPGAVGPVGVDELVVGLRRLAGQQGGGAQAEESGEVLDGTSLYTT